MSVSPADLLAVAGGTERIPSPTGNGLNAADRPSDGVSPPHSELPHGRFGYDGRLLGYPPFEASLAALPRLYESAIRRLATLAQHESADWCPELVVVSFDGVAVTQSRCRVVERAGVRVARIELADVEMTWSPECTEELLLHELVHAWLIDHPSRSMPAAIEEGIAMWVAGQARSRHASEVAYTIVSGRPVRQDRVLVALESALRTAERGSNRSAGVSGYDYAAGAVLFQSLEQAWGPSQCERVVRYVLGGQGIMESCAAVSGLTTTHVRDLVLDMAALVLARHCKGESAVLQALSEIRSGDPEAALAVFSALQPPPLDSGAGIAREYVLGMIERARGNHRDAYSRLRNLVEANINLRKFIECRLLVLQVAVEAEEWSDAITEGGSILMEFPELSAESRMIVEGALRICKAK